MIIFDDGGPYGIRLYRHASGVISRPTSYSCPNGPISYEKFVGPDLSVGEIETSLEEWRSDIVEILSDEDLGKFSPNEDIEDRSGDRFIGNRMFEIHPSQTVLLKSSENRGDERWYEVEIKGGDYITLNLTMDGEAWRLLRGMLSPLRRKDSNQARS